MSAASVLGLRVQTTTGATSPEPKKYQATAPTMQAFGAAAFKASGKTTLR
ncbi:hypothetical protein [Hymenobacter sp. HSC-4F20]|nr:hypothetical protein [Hymenobacter sp. HSC-4F20]